jgi:hypothetical protein
VSRILRLYRERYLNATSRTLYAQLWPERSTRAVLTALPEVVETYGIPASLYTDRAGWTFETPKAGQGVSTTRLTQAGEVLKCMCYDPI